VRTDAKRNREQLLVAAADVFAECDASTASLEEIARRAGVGIGTLYRHFPTRAALIEAVYRHEVELLCGGLDELRERYAPDAALAEWMQRFVGYAAIKRGLMTAMREMLSADSDVFAHCHGLVTQSLSGLVADAVAAGTIRADTDPEDLLRAMSGFCLAGDQVGWQERAQRLVALLMDGLRYGAAQPREATLGAT
jgi:AcrR family transcriptional regulator